MMCDCLLIFILFFFNDTATTEIYTLSLHDALPIYTRHPLKPIRLMVGLLMLAHLGGLSDEQLVEKWVENPYWQTSKVRKRSEEHTSELQSRRDLVCRLLLEKKKKKKKKKKHTSKRK